MYFNEYVKEAQLSLDGKSKKKISNLYEQWLKSKREKKIKIGGKIFNILLKKEKSILSNIETIEQLISYYGKRIESIFGTDLEELINIIIKGKTEKINLDVESLSWISHTINDSKKAKEIKKVIINDNTLNKDNTKIMDDFNRFLAGEIEENVSIKQYFDLLSIIKVFEES